VPAEVWAIEREGVDERVEWDDRANWRNANLMALLANIHGDPRSGRTWRPDDFMPRRDPTEEELEAKLEAILGSVGVKRK
jgi:hypothetical protein